MTHGMTVVTWPGQQLWNAHSTITGPSGVLPVQLQCKGFHQAPNIITKAGLITQVRDRRWVCGGWNSRDMQHSVSMVHSVPQGARYLRHLVLAVPSAWSALRGARPHLLGVLPHMSPSPWAPPFICHFTRSTLPTLCSPTPSPAS